MKNRKYLILILIIPLIFAFGRISHGQTTEIPDYADEYGGEGIRRNIPNPQSPSLDPCPNPEREPRFVYREKVVHEERQFRAEHTGCGGDILMRKWQVVGLEIGRCDGGPNEECNNPEWMDEFVYYYDRYTPNQDGEIFDEVGSWQKAWPASAQWLTEKELKEKYGEPIPFPTCQSDCLQSPPGVPEGVGVSGQEDPYYFNNPWLPEIIGGEKPHAISQLRQKNILGGDNPLDRAQLPVKLFWWNIPGWQGGWIENGEYKTCEDDPENIACVNSYIIRFDNINREDRPALFHRHEVVNRLIEDAGYSYRDAQRKFEDLQTQNRRAYERYRVNQDDTRSLDVMRYDRDNIIGCQNCGTEKEIWLNDNTFNPLEFDPKHDYDRDQREWMKNWLLDQFEDSDPVLLDIIEEVYDSYGRPSFFRSGVEHSYSLQAACSPHDYLEEEEGARGPEATFSFETSDAPELISPIDPSWTTPYDAKEYDPNFDPSRLQSTSYGHDKGYRYPAETTQSIGDSSSILTIDGPLSDFLEDPTNPLNVNGRERRATDGERGPSKNSPEAQEYTEYIANTASNVDMNLAEKIVQAGGTDVIPPEEYWQNIIPTAEILGLIEREVGHVNVTSTYRPLEYNRRIGSSDGSQHVQNTAIDFWSPNATTRQLHQLALHLRDNENLFTGGIGIYPSSGFVHIDTRGYDANWGEQYASNSSGTLEAGEQSFMREEAGLGSWWNNLSDKTSIWSEESYNLVFQDQVSFREELRWAQQWYQPSPDMRPEPPRKYLMSFGEGILVTRETIDEYGEPVLEDCHSQLTDTYEDNPICTYRERPVGTHESQHRYPEPNHMDREMEFFTLPENREEDIYTWNIASCRDRASTDCTDFSQLWRFQLDERETERLFPPRNVNPENYLNEGVSEDDATTGFPFKLQWDRRFGAKSYAYRLREKGDDDWQIANVQHSNDVYFSTGKIEDFGLDLDLGLGGGVDSYSILRWTGDLELDTTYEWDVKACWDEYTNHGLDENDYEEDEDYAQAIIEWIENSEVKQCSNWRSEDPNYDDAPFRFRTGGRPPKEEELVSPISTEDTQYPVNFEWNSVPGAEAYAIVIEKCEDHSVFNPCDTENIEISEADRGAIVRNSSFSFLSDIELDEFYRFQIYSCINPITEGSIYFSYSDDDGSDLIESPIQDMFPSLSDMTDDMTDAGCHPGLPSESFLFRPHLPAPTNLSPGNKDSDTPDRINIEDSQQKLSWDYIPGAEAYRVVVNPPTEANSSNKIVERVYAENNEDSNEFIVENNELLYNFSNAGHYNWTVQACITDNCESFFQEDEAVRSDKSESSHVEVYIPSFLGGGVVPCGRNIDIFEENPNLDSRDDCQPLHLFVMIGRIIEEILIKIIVPYSLVILLLYTGYLYYTGLGDPKTMQKVFKVWEYALKGYLLIFLSWFIVGAFLSLVGYQFGSWWEITNL